MRIAPVGACATSDSMAQPRWDASRAGAVGGFGGHIGQLSIAGRFTATRTSTLDIAPREAIPAELLFARIGHWYTGLTIAGATDSANVFVGMSKGKAPDGALAQVLTAVVTGLHALGADLFATWVCREANGWADALAGALTIDAAIAVTRGWHARIHASRAARTHSTKGKG